MALTWERIVWWWREVAPKRCANPSCRKMIVPRVVWRQPPTCRWECSSEVARLLRAHYGGEDEEVTPRSEVTLPRLLWETTGDPERCGCKTVCQRFPWCDCSRAV